MTGGAPRLVIGVGPSARDAASTVARRRGAETVLVRDLDAAVAALGGDPWRSVIVVADLAQTSIEDLLELARTAAVRCPDLPLSVLYGRGEAGLLEAATRIPVEPSIGASGDRARLMIAGDAGFALDGGARLDVIAPQRAAGEVTQPCELLLLGGHANAMHVSIGGAVLCRRASQPDVGDDLRVYPCYRGEPCHFGRNRDEKEVRIDTIAATRLVLLSCFGATLVDEPFAPAWSIGEGLLRHSRAESVVTCPRAATLGSNDLALTYFLCVAGVPLGAVASRLNAARIALGLDPEFLCFGDPESALEPSISATTAIAHGGQIRIDADTIGAEATDVTATVPEGTWLPDPVFVDETRGDVKAFAIEPPNRVYVSLPRGWKGQPILLRTAAREELEGSLSAIGDLTSHAGFLHAYTSHLLRVNGQSAPLMRLHDTVHALRATLDTWPHADVATASRITDAEAARGPRTLGFVLDDAGRAFINAYVALMVADQRTHMTPWDAISRMQHVSRNHRRCRYCGHGVDEFTHVARAGGWTRRWGLCRAGCAFVYDGVPDVGCWITADPLHAGKSADVFVPVRNPYRMTMPVHAAAVLKRFERGTSIPSPVASFELDAGESADAAVRLTIPAGVIAGVYHVTACTIVGAQVSFFRAQMTVRAHTVVPIIAHRNERVEVPVAAGARAQEYL